MPDMLYTLIKVLVMVVGLVVTTYIVPLIKEKTNTTQFDMVVKYVKILVASAEQLKATGQIDDDKKIYVLNKLAQWLRDKGLKFTDEQINDLIESAVKELNK